MSGLAAFSVEGPLVAVGDNLVSQWLCIKALWTLKAVFFFLFLHILLLWKQWPNFLFSIHHPHIHLTVSIVSRLSALSKDPPPPWHVAPLNLSASHCALWLPEPRSIEPGLIDDREMAHKVTEKKAGK